MTVDLLKRTLAVKLVGRPYQEKRRKRKLQHVRAREMQLWFDDKELGDQETIGSLGVGDMESMWCFKSAGVGQAEFDFSLQKRRARELDHGAAERTAKRAGI